jgi:2-oxoglutarate dehydrogenase E1 component
MLGLQSGSGSGDGVKLRWEMSGCMLWWPPRRARASGHSYAHGRPLPLPPRRGRLNVLVHLLGKPLGALCSEMEGLQSEFKVGDVKYHLGQSGALEVDSPGCRKTVQLSIAPNPSHLEAVCPVVLGLGRAALARRAAAAAAAGDGGSAEQRWAAAARGVMGLLIHGDAAFSGLGLTAETLQLSDLPGYSTGGTIHVVVNNQVGAGARRAAPQRAPAPPTGQPAA